MSACVALDLGRSPVLAIDITRTGRGSASAVGLPGRELGNRTNPGSSRGRRRTLRLAHRTRGPRRRRGFLVLIFRRGRRGGLGWLFVDGSRGSGDVARQFILNVLRSGSSLFPFCGLLGGTSGFLTWLVELIIGRRGTLAGAVLLTERLTERRCRRPQLGMVRGLGFGALRESDLVKGGLRRREDDIVWRTHEDPTFPSRMTAKVGHPF